MKGHDTINRYCGRLENRLKDIENKEKIVNEIKQHLTEQAESYMEEGCLPEAAELLAIEAMGSDISLASNLKKYGEKIQKERENVIDTVSEFQLKTILEYSGYRTMTKGFGNVKFRIVLYPVLIVLYIGVIWNILSYPTVAFENNRETAIRYIGIFCVMAVTAFSLLLSSLDRYRPYFCRKNILWLLGALAAAVLAYQPVKIFFLYGTYYIINIYTYFAEVRAAKIFYIVQKVVLALIAAAVLHFGLKEKARYIVMTVVSAIVPLAGLFISGDLLDLHWCIILLFVTVASIYITLYCKNKYKVRLTVQLFGIMGLMEAAAVYLLEINQ